MAFFEVAIESAPSKYVEEFVRYADQVNKQATFVPLQGSPKQVNWATSVRQDLVAAFMGAYRDLCTYYVAWCGKNNLPFTAPEVKGLKDYYVEGLSALAYCDSCQWFIHHRFNNQKNILRLLYKELGLGESIAPLLLRFFAFAGLL